MNLPPPSLSLASLSLGSPLAPVGAPVTTAEPAGDWFLAADGGARITLPGTAAAPADVSALAQRVLDHLLAR
jgi:hypothetical protein